MNSEPNWFVKGGNPLKGRNQGGNFHATIQKDKINPYGDHRWFISFLNIDLNL